MSEGFAGFVGGVLVTAVIGTAIFRSVTPELKIEELYRFCLVKAIPLEECKIPPRPFERELQK